MTTLLKPPQAAATKKVLVTQASHGIKAVVTRQIVTKLLGFISSLVLARLLSPKDFGIFAIVGFAVTIFGLIADAGLAVALLRQPTEPTIEEESSIFWCQVILASIHFALVQVFAAPVGNLYHFSEGSILLIRLLSVGSLLAVFITLPMIRLERHLNFGAQAKIEMFQSFAYNLSAILFAFFHQGAWTFGLATLVGQVVAIAMLQFLSPFRPKFCLSTKVCREKLGFGLKYQGTNVLAFFKDTVNPLFVGLVSGATAVGFVNFAGTTAGYSLLVTTPFARLYFPIFCRAQHEQELVVRVAETAVRWNFLIVTGLTAVALPFTDLLVTKIFGTKWLPSVPVLDCILIANTVVGLAYPLYALSNAINRADLPFKLSLCTCAISWVTLPVVLPWMGLNGFGALQIFNQILTLGFVYFLQQEIPLKIWNNCVKHSLFAALATLALASAIKHFSPAIVSNFAGLIGVFVVSTCFYYALSNCLWKNLLLTEARTFLASLKSRAHATAGEAS